MSKIIIRNDSDSDDDDALRYVSRVIESGKISGEGMQYCYHTSFHGKEFETHVSCVIRKSGTMTFYVTREAKGEGQ